ncbi:uncharacterized protein [Musca autumnalis]|uniref:uncharacterized protein n=1 Tax=Musca autumnalis TaxID=221902 RepID=UPI003CF88B77
MSKIAYSTFQRLGLRSVIYQNRRFATFKIMARRTNNFWALKVNALITDELPRRPNSDPILEDPTSYFTPQALADPDPRSNIPIDLELGADVFSAIHLEGCTPAGIGDVKAFNTKLDMAAYNSNNHNKEDNRQEADQVSERADERGLVFGNILVGYAKTTTPSTHVPGSESKPYTKDMKRSNAEGTVEIAWQEVSAIHLEGCTPAGIGDVKAFNTKLGYVFSCPIKNMPTN